MARVAEKLIRDKLEERVLAGALRNETDPARIMSLLDARLDQDIDSLRQSGPGEPADYADILEVLFARAAREGISRDQIEAARLERLEQRGGFDSFLVWAPPDPAFFVAHEIPRRLRFIGAGLKGDAQACNRAAELVGALPGVESAAAVPLTGSLTVAYDGAPKTRKAIVRALEEFSGAPIDGETPRPVLLPRDRLRGGIKAVVAHGVENAAEEVLEEAVRAAVATIL
jgi:predicted house-cleaning noncanonical NTP pyrophosphatase (MazG superfamily)